MDLILCMIIFILVNIGLLFFIKWIENNIGVYDIRFCKDVRAQMGMFAYKSDVVEIRKKLNRPNSKF